jgi:hypothetical protein
MQMASSYSDCLKSDGHLSGLFDFTMPSFMPSWLGGPSATPTQSVDPSSGGYIPAVAQVDTSPSFWSQLPGILTAGLNTFSTVEMMKNPQVAASILRPSGVTGQYNPYDIPTGSYAPPGVTPTGQAYPPGYFAPPPPPTSIMPMIMIGAGGLLLIALMSGNKR